MSTNQVPNSPNPVADTPQPVTTMTPEQVVEQLRSLRAQIPEVAPLTVEQRKVLRAQSRVSRRRKSRSPPPHRVHRRGRVQPCFTVGARSRPCRPRSTRAGGQAAQELRAPEEGANRSAADLSGTSGSRAWCVGRARCLDDPAVIM